MWHLQQRCSVSKALRVLVDYVRLIIYLPSRAKRYERMMKAHAIGPEPPYNSKDSPDSQSKKDANTTKPKKRKVSSDDDEEEKERPKLAFANKKGKKGERAVKDEFRHGLKHEDVTVKEEASADVYPGEYTFQLQPWETDQCLTGSQLMPLPMTTGMDLREPSGHSIHAFNDYIKANTPELGLHGRKLKYSTDGTADFPNLSHGHGKHMGFLASGPGHSQAIEDGYAGNVNYTVPGTVDPSTLEQGHRGNLPYPTTEAFADFDGTWYKMEESSLAEGD